MRDTCAQNSFTNDAALAQVAAELRIIDYRSGWSRTLAIGELILRRFFNNDIHEWRTHRRDKDASIRRLAKRNDCPLGRSALSEAVAVYVASSELVPASLRDQLSPSHLAATLKVDRAQRVELLERAIAARWTVRELRAHVAETRKTDGERRGRPRSSPPSTALTYLRNAALMLHRAEELIDTAHNVDPDVLRRLHAALGKAEDQLAELRLRLGELAVSPRVTLAPTINKARADRVEPKRAAS
jgi:hypothetical protein